MVARPITIRRRRQPGCRADDARDPSARAAVRPFLLTGERLVVSGVVRPFEAGQSVTVRFAEDGRRVATSTVSVLPRAQRDGPLPPWLLERPGRAWCR